jgi:hypothetical protein
MDDPIDYNALYNSVRPVTAGLDQFQAQQQASLARQLQVNQIQQQLRQQAAQQQALQAVLANPTGQNYANLALLHPDIAPAIKQAHDLGDEDAQRQNLQHMTGIYNYLDPKVNQPDKALALVEQYRSAAQKAGRPTDQFDVMADMIKTRPEQARVLVGMGLTSIVGADKMTENLARLGGEQRAESAEPGKEALTAAQTEQANAAATKDRYITAGQDQTVLALPGAAGSAPATGATPAPAEGDSRAARNNNPLNLTNLPQGKWAGQTGSDGQFATFATPAAGLAAADKNLVSYAKNHNINTIQGVIDRWAPKGDGANDPKAYAATVAADLGVAPDAKINLTDPKVRQNLLASMAKVEAGGSSPAQASEAPGQLKTVFQGPMAGEGGDLLLPPEAIAMTGYNYLVNGPSALQNMGQGKFSIINKNRVMKWAADAARDAGTDNPVLVAQWAQNKAANAALGKIQSTLSLVSGSEGTVQKNMDIVLGLAPRGAGPTGSPLLNSPIQTLRKNVWGSPQVARFDAALGTVADEYAKVMTTSTGTGGQASSDAARKEAYDRLSKAYSIAQLQDVMSTMKQEMHNRTSSLGQERQNLLDMISGKPGANPSGFNPGHPAAPGGAPAGGQSAAPDSGASSSGWGKAVVVRR